ncbi:MAG TPA: hypothetical protein VE820_05790, partial [Sphingomicrobium sp.]|nr:hypothetical protein [Sphingomicrobium sp.]
MTLVLESARGATAAANEYEAASKAGKTAADDQSFVQTLNDLVQGLSEQVAVVDESWTIMAVNEAWKQMVRIAGYPE